jgi:molecular chaperone IbpA
MNNLVRWERYSPVSLGLNEMFNRLDALADNGTSYPPYNIVRVDNETQELQIALAGFKRDDIEVAVEKGVLSVNAKSDVEEGEFIHKGIAKRNVAKNWQLGDNVEVEDPTFENGLLRIVVKVNVPEAQKRKLLPIA